MPDEQFVGALAQAFSGNQMVAILVALGVNFALGVIRALLEKSFSWDKLPGIIEKSLILIPYGALSVGATAIGGQAGQAINWGAAAGVVLRYALPALRDGSAILKDLESPITLNKLAKAVEPLKVGDLVSHRKYQGMVIHIKELKGDKADIVVYLPGGGDTVIEVATKDLSPT